MKKTKKIVLKPVPTKDVEDGLKVVIDDKKKKVYTNITTDIKEGKDEYNLPENLKGEVSDIESPNENNCAYKLTLNFNNNSFHCYTNDLKIGILSFKPEALFTEGYIKIEKGEATFERRYSLVDLRKILNDEERLELFISQLQLG